MILVADIQRAVALRYRCPLSAMKEPDGINARIRRRVWPRQVAMVLAARLTEHSYVRIGQFFGGRDHSTVMYACDAVEKRGKKNPKLRQSLRRLTLELIQQSQAPRFHKSEITALVSCPGWAD